MPRPVCKYRLCTAPSTQESKPSAELLTPQTLPSLARLQVPTELLRREVSVHHAARAVPRGLQPDHGSGRGCSGAVVRLPHHHWPFIDAQVSKTRADATLPAIRVQKSMNIILNKLLFFLLFFFSQVLQAGSLRRGERGEGQAGVSAQPLKRR